MLRNLGDNPWILLILVLIIVLVFGANRLPGAARSLGRSMRIFKSEVKEMKEDGGSSAATSNEERSGAPLEGRVVDPPVDRPKTTEHTHGDARRDA